MADLTQFSQKKLLDHTLGIASWTSPTVYAGLFTAAPGETGSLTGEVAGNNYARVELTSKMGATTLATGIATNSSAVTFNAPSGDWGMLTHLGIIDASSTGNVLIYAPLLFPMLVNGSSPAPSFAIGDIIIAGLLESTQALTKYTAKKWLDHLLGKASFTQPTNCYLGMFSADPTADGTLTNEIATGGYARQIITGGIMSSTDLTSGISTNGDHITFPIPTAEYSVTHFGVMDALTTGNMLFRKARGTTLSVHVGSPAIRIDIGGFQLRAD